MARRTQQRHCRPLTLVRALKEGGWDAARMADQLDEDLLPDCPFPGASARYVWDDLRELQLAYQDRDDGWRDVPAQFERLARALPTLVEIERLASTIRASHPRGRMDVDRQHEPNRWTTSARVGLPGAECTCYAGRRYRTGQRI